MTSRRRLPPRAFTLILASLLPLAALSPAQAQYSSPSLHVASNGPIQFTTLANDPSRFPGFYHGNVLFRGAPSPGNPAGTYAFTMFGIGNPAGTSNTLAGIPTANGNPSAFVPRNLPIVVQFNMERSTPTQPWASTSTRDGSNLVSEFVRAPEFTPNQPIVQVRQGPGNSVELGFSWISDTVRRFADNPLRIRVTNVGVCSG